MAAQDDAVAATGDPAEAAGTITNSRSGPVAGAGPEWGPVREQSREPVWAAGGISSQAGLATFRPWPVETAVNRGMGDREDRLLRVSLTTDI